MSAPSLGPSKRCDGVFRLKYLPRGGAAILSGASCPELATWHSILDLGIGLLHRLSPPPPSLSLPPLNSGRKNRTGEIKMLSLHSLPLISSSPVHRLPRSLTHKPPTLTRPPLPKRPTLLSAPFLLKAISNPDPQDPKAPPPLVSKSTDVPDDFNANNDNNPTIPVPDSDTSEDNDDSPGGENEDDKPDPPDDSLQAQSSRNTTSTLYLAVVFGLWYFQNVIFNIYNKKALNLFPYPWLLASFQLLVGSLWMAFLWLTGLQPYPKVSRKFFMALLGPALFHTIGHISACVSFSKVAVSFTHVIKASEPVFSVIFSAFYGQFYPIHVWLSVLPIVFGCSLAVVTEVSFNAQGLWGALISNVGFVLRNIYSKQSLHDFKHINGLNLYGWISIISLVYLFPVAVLVEGKQWGAGFERAIAMSSSPWTFYSWVLLSGVFYHLYNQSSYQALDKISPLSFSVGNTMKRVVVIVASLLVFRNPVRPLNALGSAIAVFGTFLYSQATVMGKNKKKEKMS